MALPPEVLDPAIAVIATYCATKVPSEHDDMLKIEYKVHGECRPPWREDFISVAIRDGEITGRERDDLYLVGETLGIGDVKKRMEQPRAPGPANGVLGRSTELAGQTVCFTGSLTCRHEGELQTRQKATALAAAAGLTVLPRVTKKLDLLVLADPDSMSGKARRAREYGVRLIAETAFWEMIGVEVSLKGVNGPDPFVRPT